MFPFARFMPWTFVICYLGSLPFCWVFASAFENDLVSRSDLIPSFKGQVIAFDQQLADSKPLAAADRAGWYIDDEWMIGAPRGSQADNAVGAKSLKSQTWAWWVSGRSKLSAPVSRIGNHIYLQYADGLVRRVELATGKIVWEYELSQNCDHPAVVVNGKVFFWTVSQSLYALSEEDGRVQWQVDAGAPSGMILTGRAKPLVHQGNVWVGLASGNVLLISAETGQKVSEIVHDAKRLGRFKDAVALEVLDGDRILMAFASGFVAVQNGSSATTPRIWEREFEAISVVRVEGDAIYLGFLDGKIHKLSLESGKTLWEARSYGTLQSIFSNAVSVIAVSTTGVVAKLRAENGSLQVLDDLHASVIAPVVFHSNTAWVATGQKNLYSFKF